LQKFSHAAESPLKASKLIECQRTVPVFLWRESHSRMYPEKPSENRVRTGYFLDLFSRKVQNTESLRSSKAGRQVLIPQLFLQEGNSLLFSLTGNMLVARRRA
jgi:hypothetical protein